VKKEGAFEKLALLRKPLLKVIYLKTFNSDTHQISSLPFKSVEKIHTFSISNQNEALEIYNYKFNRIDIKKSPNKVWGFT
jgi:hypothetical protein